MQDALFIVNPISGNRFKKSRIVAIIRRAGYPVVYTEYAGHAEQLAFQASCRIIVAVGGDGTVNEVARGIIRSNAVLASAVDAVSANAVPSDGTPASVPRKILGIVPCGSGDGLALHLGISRIIFKALETIEKCRTVPLDEGFINGRAFFSVCGTGLDAIVSERFASSPTRGLHTYIKEALETWHVFSPEEYTLSIDGVSFSEKASIITVGNSSEWGNFARIAPDADTSDGLLDVTVVGEFHNKDIPALVGSLFDGSLSRNPLVKTFRGRHVTIVRPAAGPAHFDGDFFNADKTLDIQVVPSALEVIVPSQKESIIETIRKWKFSTRITSKTAFAPLAKKRRPTA